MIILHIPRPTSLRTFFNSCFQVTWAWSSAVVLQRWLHGRYSSTSLQLRCFPRALRVAKMALMGIRLLGSYSPRSNSRVSIPFTNDKSSGVSILPLRLVQSCASLVLSSLLGTYSHPSCSEAPKKIKLLTSTCFPAQD